MGEDAFALRITHLVLHCLAESGRTSSRQVLLAHFAEFVRRVVVVHVVPDARKKRLDREEWKRADTVRSMQSADDRCE